MNETNKNVKQDPKAGVLGDHPVAVGLGAVGAEARLSPVLPAGPLPKPRWHAVAGAAVGAVVAGARRRKGAAEAFNPTTETKFWRDTHSTRPYATSAFSYDEYAPAYRYGWESYNSRGDKGQTFQSAEGVLGQGWDKAKGASRLVWDQAKDASRDAWNRVDSAAHGFVSPAAH